MLGDRRFVEIIRLPLDDLERILGAFSQTGAKAVAVLFRRQAGLAVDDLDRPCSSVG